MKFYKAHNKRLIARGGNGRFRKTTMRDVGMGRCEYCNKLFMPDYSLAQDGLFVDPLLLRKIERTCPECMEK